MTAMPSTINGQLSVQPITHCHTFLTSMWSKRLRKSFAACSSSHRPNAAETPLNSGGGTCKRAQERGG